MMRSRSVHRSPALAVLGAGAGVFGVVCFAWIGAPRAGEAELRQAGAAGSPGAQASQTPARGSPSAAPPAASVSVEPSRARIGDRIRLTVTIQGAEGLVALPPAGISAGSKLGLFRILDVQTAEPGALVVDLTPEETGEIEIPSFEALFKDRSGAERKVEVPARKLRIASVLGDGDTSLADLKPPAVLPAPWPWREIGIGAAGLALLVAAIIWLRRRAKAPRRPPSVAEEMLPPGMTADAWARSELEKLLARDLLDAGLSRQFHIELADLARRYLELRFRIPALERTTEEIAVEVRRALLGEDVSVLTGNLLAQCDRVKFAKHLPERREIEGTVSLFREMLARTAPAASALTASRELGAAEGSAA